MNDAYQQMAASAICHAASMAGEEARAAAAEYARPCVVWKPKLYVEGNQWCALLDVYKRQGLLPFRHGRQRCREKRLRCRFGPYKRGQLDCSWIAPVVVVGCAGHAFRRPTKPGCAGWPAPSHQPVIWPGVAFADEPVAQSALREGIPPKGPDWPSGCISCEKRLPGWLPGCLRGSRRAALRRLPSTPERRLPRLRS